MSFLAITVSLSSAFAGGGSVGSDKNDPNLEQDGPTYTVKRDACLNYGGQVTDDDKRYYICEGGRYDGYITAGPVTHVVCNVQVANTKKLVKKDGTVADEEEFLRGASASLIICEKTAKDWASVKQTLKLAKKSCDESADQGMSALYRGVCYLKAAELATFTLGQ